ncbi:hypothetical protein PRIPAC_92647 [Pristionchus pacificus]|uniref:Uncharacterized protein n=1 Tax=Pristionchus pacificus TaxID=54126 RepID=A0A2A6BQN5_PRIPA|nr:hypothetical protein PRIPAC_92647 [Pristionchus pacificus]|eukprot:PDM68229.1 hypothetical protein PRIPAC_46273 [Pristionchus pacificus]
MLQLSIHPDSMAAINVVPLTLTSLPADIIRKIIRMDGVSAGNERLISRTWNLLVGEYRQYRKRLPALERAEFRKKNGWLYLVLIIMPQGEVNFEKFRFNKNGSRKYEGNIRRYECWRIDRAPWYYNEYLADEEIACAISCILLRFRSISILVVNKCCDKSRRIIENALRRDIPVNANFLLLMCTRVSCFWFVEGCIHTSMPPGLMFNNRDEFWQDV